jgi:hypothetical protein
VQWCWRSLDPRFTKKVKHGGRKVIVCGLITPRGLGRLMCIEGNLDKHLYYEILQDDFLGTLDDLNLDLNNYYFQQDNPIY